MLIGEWLGNKIGDDGIEALSEALKTNTTVNDFYIGSETMCFGDLTNRFMVVLNAAETEIGAEGLYAACEMLKKNTMIRRFDLGGLG